MIIPSSVVLAKGAEFNIKEVAKGLYTITNAYIGEYQYFKDRPIAGVATEADPMATSKLDTNK